jgi:hypothetical protein
MASIRITCVPPGEAPLEIRQAWVGLVLPLHRKRAGGYFTSGVLSGPRSALAVLRHLLTFRYKIQRGYVVSSQAAIAALEAVNPTAAHWWRDNTRHKVGARRYFLFATECCEPLE